MRGRLSRLHPRAYRVFLRQVYAVGTLHHVDISPQYDCCAADRADDVSAVPHGDYINSLLVSTFLPPILLFSFAFMSFVKPIQTDEKVAFAPTVQPPSYRMTTPSADAESEPGRPIHRRRFRRLCHFFIAALFIWVTARHVLRHCEERKFGRSHFDRVHWVSLRWR